MWMMPKHVFETQAIPANSPSNPPVSLGAYTLYSFDPNGGWFIWQLRDDCSVRRWPLRQAGPKYVAYLDPGPPDKRVIAQLKPSSTSSTTPRPRACSPRQAGEILAWLVQGLPFAHPDPTLAAVILNDQLESSRIATCAGPSAADRHEAGVDGLLSRRRHHLGDRLPPTGPIPTISCAARKLAQGFRARYRQAQIKALRPRRRQRHPEIAAPVRWARQIPTKPDEIAKASAAAGGSPTRKRRRSCSSGPAFAKRGDKWYTPDGKPFAHPIHRRGASCAR